VWLEHLLSGAYDVSVGNKNIKEKRLVYLFFKEIKQRLKFWEQERRPKTKRLKRGERRFPKGRKSKNLKSKILNLE
jgi:hypothetical protein